MSEKPYKITRRDLLRAASVGDAAMGAEVAALGLQQKPATRIDQTRTPNLSGAAATWSKYRDSAVKAAGQSVNLWKLSAKLVGVKIMAVSAIGGRLEGLPLDSNMRALMLRYCVPAEVAAQW